MNTAVHDEGYDKALMDMAGLIENAELNQGGVNFGPIFIQNAHWGYEIKEQLTRLAKNKSTQHIIQDGVLNAKHR